METRGGIDKSTIEDTDESDELDDHEQIQSIYINTKKPFICSSD